MTLYSISHYMQPWFLPPGINLFLFIMGIVFWFYSRMIGNILILTGMISLWLLSMPIIAYPLVNLLQNQYPVLQINDSQNQKNHLAIVVLGGGDTYEMEHNNKQTVSDATWHRINYAVFLHRKLHLPIILSGGKSKGSSESEADLMAKFLQEHYNIKADYIEDKSLTTAEESKFLLSILKKNQFDGMVLVTHAWHMPRSVYIFQCKGTQLIPAPMGHYVYGPGYALISYLPNLAALSASSTAIHEFIGLFWYKIHYARQCI